MLGLTLLGTIHTAISLIALVAGFTALVQYRDISLRSTAGKIFVGGTVLSCLTGFGIFQHGGFGNPHILAIVTLIVLGAAFASSRMAGRAARYVKTLAYSFALFLHFIPGTVETLVFFLLFLAGAALQAWRLRRAGAAVGTVGIRA